MAKYVHVKTEEAILDYSPDGQMVKVSVSQAVPKSMHGFESNLTFFFL